MMPVMKARDITGREECMLLSVERESQKKKVSRLRSLFLYVRNRVSCRSALLSLAFCLAAMLTLHRLVSTYMNHLPLISAPITFLERQCPKPEYATLLDSSSLLGDINSSNPQTKICLTTLTDAKSASFIHRLLRWRNFDAVSSMSWENKVRYAKKHNYKFVDSSDRMESSRPPSWSKIRALQRLLLEENCDWAVWVDADAVIMNSDVKIESFLPADQTHDLLLASDDRQGGYNAGVLVFRKSEWSTRFLNDWWSMKSYVRPPGLSLSGDNDALKAKLREMNDFDAHVLVPPRCTFNSFARFMTAGQLDQVKPSLTRQEWYMSENYYHKGDFIAHIAGYDNKVETMRLLMKDAQ